MARKHVEILPAQGVDVAALALNLAEGEHPAAAQAFTSLHALPAVNPSYEIFALHLPVAPLTNGHHHISDDGFRATLGGPESPVDSWPLAPVFVRDVAGRVVHTGLNPLPVPPTQPLMPESCQYVPPTTAGYELLDKTFFTSFRRLEWAYGEGTKLTGRPHITLHAVYNAPQLCPYKLRVDSFYQDGFRLPQTERLFVNSADPQAAGALGAELLARWNARPTDQSYADFYEANDGDTWFETMFANGCTVIPTTEAANGNYKVTNTYGIEDAWPGCVIEGLHEVVDYKHDASPAGTILSVLQPGYATREHVVPAQVIASDGSGYASPLGEVPDPLQPNPQFPHPRVADCTAVWLPTHPGHFELPALWDWNAHGHFQQKSGPLWDPLHYTYTSTPRILKAFRTTAADTPDQAPVPPDMLPQFHPVCGLTGYDTFNTTTQAFRGKQAGSSPFHTSSIDTVPLGREVAGIGYHPLPAALEYELDPFMFPHLGPWGWKGDKPERPAPIITSSVDAEEARKLMVITHEPAAEMLLQPVNFEGGYGLERYSAEALPEASAHLGWCYLPHLPTSELMVNVKRFFLSKAYITQLERVHPALYKQFYQFREQSLAYRRLRHRLARKYPGWYLWLWWFGHSPTRAEEALGDNPDFAMLEAERLLKGQLGAVVGPS